MTMDKILTGGCFYLGSKDRFLNLLETPYGYFAIEGMRQVLVHNSSDGYNAIREALEKGLLSDEVGQELKFAIARTNLFNSPEELYEKIASYTPPNGYSPDPALEFKYYKADEFMPIQHGYWVDTPVFSLDQGLQICLNKVNNGSVNPIDAIIAFQQMHNTCTIHKQASLKNLVAHLSPKEMVALANWFTKSLEHGFYERAEIEEFISLFSMRLVELD